MAGLDANKMPKWLGVTPQQFSILEAMIRLQKRGDSASPKSIIDEDASFRKVPKIQKSNFFSQLKGLQGIGYVKKTAGATYSVDFDSIKSSLEDARVVADQEANEISKVKKEAESYLKSISSGEKRPSVAFLEYDDMYKTVADLLKNSDYYCITGVFPKILYAHSPALMKSASERRYAQMLWERCIGQNEMEVTYLTVLDTEYLFHKLLRVYKNPVSAYEETKMILRGLEDLLKESPKFHLLYKDSPYGLDMIIPRSEETNTLFLMIRDANKTGIGAVYINSTELAARFQSLFEDECEGTIDMKSKMGRNILDDVERKLDRVYAEYRRKRT